MLHNAGFLSLSESLTNKKPTGLLLKNLAQASERLTAWGNYKLAHGIGNGRTIPWVYWFDFLHGGAQGHAALSLNEGEAPPPLILDDDDLEGQGGWQRRGGRGEGSSADGGESTLAGAAVVGWGGWLQRWNS